MLLAIPVVQAAIGQSPGRIRRRADVSNPPDQARGHTSAPASDTARGETETLLAQAAACTKRGELGQAEKLIRAVLARDPRHADALFELGRIAHATGDKRAAADCLRKAIASQPDNSQFHNELGFVLVGLGEREQALRAFTRSLEIKPDDPGAISNLGTFHLATAG